MPTEIRPWAKALRNLCLKKLKDFGGTGTAHDVAANLGKDVDIIAPRFSELAEMGVVRAAGKSKGHGKGRPRTIWELVDAADCDNSGSGHTDDEPGWFKKYGQ